MSQALTLEQITDKISHLEEEMNSVRKELAELRQQKRDIPAISIARVAYNWADKEAQIRWIDRLFISLKIERAPIGSQALQEKMGHANLTHDELSKSLIEAREE